MKSRLYRHNSTLKITNRFSLSIHWSQLPPIHNVGLTSPVPHLLSSNAPPSETEKSLIQHAIDTVSAQNDEILAISKTLGTSKLEPTTSRRLEAGLEFVHAHKGVLSPLRLLPLEILAEIISLYSESFLLQSHPHIVTHATTGVTYPWVPSQVSRLWRSAALSLHHLWAQLVVDTCLWKTKQPSKSFLGLFATLVDRSHDAPLCLYFCTPRNVDVEDLRPIIDVLVSHSERWTTVYLVSTYPVLAAFQGVKGRLSSLSRLYLSFSGDEQSTKTPIDMFETAPQLRSMYLGSSYFTGEVLLPWSQFLVFLDGGELSNGFAREKIIPSSQSLIDLHLSRFPMDDIQKSWSNSKLDDLLSLEISFNNLEEEEPHDITVDNFLGSLTTPSIRNIRITNYPGNLIPPLTLLIHRSLQCTALQTLSLSTYYLGESEAGELSSLFQLTPSLEKLSIYLPHIVDLSQLIFTPDSPPLLPNLEQLYLFVYDSVNGCEQVLSQIASSRCEVQDNPLDSEASSPKKPCRLRHMRLVFPGTVLCHTGHELLESYDSAAEEPTQTLLERVSLLKDWAPLANSLPSIFAYFWTPSPKLGLKIKRAFQVSQFFSLIENVRVNSVQELYLSDIHHLMYHIYNLSSSDLPGGNVYHIRKRAKALLDKWAPFLCSDIRNRQWAFQGAHSIVYIPKDDAIRTSPDVLTNMVYGDVFYPQKYSVSWYDLQVMLQFLD
ncbi:hypothetical protein GALMADRAFT_136765 [Galerina marginata CBS 339.88]|uniref:F-box domain-containing protein n=1 Tax=Galerina marginata (strain CBS 339.88) TaxID=685588 RepID=A0A067TAJ7_GALM3|nr:hypothetical protein GALMADRAFT_136765 [Galerina marginata CBS 339.88]